MLLARLTKRAVAALVVAVEDELWVQIKAVALME